MRYLLLACLFVASCFGYEARLFGQIGILDTLVIKKYQHIDPYKTIENSIERKTHLDTVYKFGYEQNITDHHILQGYYTVQVFPAIHLFGINYIYEIPLPYGLLGFYGGIDLGAMVDSAGSVVDETTFSSHLNLGVRYRIKTAFLELGLNTAFTEATMKFSIYGESTYKYSYPFGFILSVGLMLNFHH